MKLYMAFFLPLISWVSIFSVQAAPLPMPKAIELLYPSRIRVRLAEAVPLVHLRGFDLKIHESRKGVEGGLKRTLVASPDRLSEWEFHCQNGKIRAVPIRGGKVLDLEQPVAVHSLTGFLKFHNRPYREEIQVFAKGSTCEVINHVGLEKYLDGLVNSEFSAKWSEEAIGAQVVAARTYALHQMLTARRDTDRRYDVDATVRDQVYDGSMKEDFRASRSVGRTRGMVLTVGSEIHSTPLKAFYHSTCGGMTELPEHVWGSSYSGFRRAVRCPYCGNSPAINWQLDLTADDVEQVFAQAALDSRPAEKGWPRAWKDLFRQQKLLNLRAGRLDAEGRVSEVIMTWGGGSKSADVRISGARFRDWMGSAKFRSAAFHVIARRTAAGMSWHFEGRGNGHGVGMCQWGAKTMGEKGFKTASILKHYYPDAVLRKLW